MNELIGCGVAGEGTTANCQNKFCGVKIGRGRA